MSGARKREQFRIELPATFEAANVEDIAGALRGALDVDVTVDGTALLLDGLDARAALDVLGRSSDSVTIIAPQGHA